MGKCRSLWRCFPLTKLTKAFRRSPLFKKTLIIAGICVVYLIFVTSHFGSSSHNKTTARDDDQRGHSRGLYHAGNSEVLPVAVVAPTRPNVVYITLKAKRLKPANIRGTIRPKLRRKAKTHKFGTFTHDLVDSLERDANQTNALHTSWSDIMKVDYKHVDIPGIYDTKTDYISSSIRIYSQKPPPWFTSTDVHAMRFLADAKVVRVRKVTHGAVPSVLIFEGEMSGSPVSPKHAERDGGSACVGRCGIIRSPVDAIEVFAFHLDRVLGLNRTLPAVSRKFTFLHDNAPCPVVQWAPSPPSSVHITWAQYQRSLKHKCWLKNISPKSDSDCCSIHHHEWSRLALFDFLLQIHRRLDPLCCGFKPRLHDECGDSGCSRLEDMKLEHLTHTEEDPRHLLFTHNRGFFDRNEDNLDFRLLQGITELPAGTVGVLRNGRLRERLLQSLFIDQTFWESQGGRQGIDKLIGVLEKRAQVLLTYINAHGITLTPMNT
ncbi:hypothetical protein NQD34_007908 [Periophthalmus magnuspinnatus]|nr:hypothetical protein NQD34_007908 [Periophthalmus magnuspinnatus]